MSLIMCTHEEEQSTLAHGIVLCTQEEADQYLMHYRVGGEKKGRRRWQDTSGRLTPEGYKHYAEMYGWNRKVKKAENLQNKADKASDNAQNAVRRSDDAIVKAYNAKQRNKVLPEFFSDRRQAKLDKLNAKSERLKVTSAQANLDAMNAQKKAVDYADKLQRKEDRMSKYVDEKGDLTEEAQNKYAYATGLPGEKKMSLFGRLKFGNEYSNKFNNEHKTKMTKEEIKEWSQKEMQKFDEETKAEQEMINLSKKMDKFDKLSDEDKAETRSNAEKRLEELNKKEKDEGLTHDERKMQDGLDDWLQQRKAEDMKFVNSDRAREEFNGNKEHDDTLRDVPADVVKDSVRLMSDWYNDEQYETQEQRVAELKYLTGKIDKEGIHRDALKEVGDDLLSYLDDRATKYDKLFNPNGKWDGKAYNKAANDPEFQDFRDLSNWMVEKVYEKSGSWNSGDFKPNSHGKKAYEAYDAACDALWKREEEVKKEQKISGDIGRYSYSSKNEKEYQKLQKALKNDSTWQKLNEAVNKADKDLCGAILKDLGFRDTPANRYLIAQWAFID